MGGGKGGGKQTVGYKYYLGMHLVLAHGPLDRLLRIRIGGKTAWSGSSTGGRINIDKPGLFGGESREGGVVGALDYAAGGPDQTANDYLAARLGSTRLPAFRGVAACVLRQMYIGMNPYLKNWEFRAQRVYTQPDGGPQWYEQTAAIGQFSDMALYLALDVSGSMGGIRLNTAKLALSIALDELASHADAHVFDVMVVAWSSSSSAILRRNVTAEDLADIKSWINSLTASGGTDFREAVAAAPEFFAGAGHKPRTVVFITDGIPNAGTVEPARDTLFSVAGVRSYGINIVLADTTSTARMDNTPEDGIPVVSETDPTPLRDAIMNGLVVHVDMNPAHIIRECLTSRDWGMGHPEADIEDTSFRAAADTLYDEGMGLSLLWDREQPLEEFVQVVLDHIDGHLFVEPTTGLWTLRLVRDDYDAETLLTFNES
ncbi:MAG TPA: vWA domain-containing protein, partial [Arenicellales bacterium]|nr:vWA domain-containing protein [Arenicellales bacterium]